MRFLLATLVAIQSAGSASEVRQVVSFRLLAGKAPDAIQIFRDEALPLYQANEPMLRFRAYREVESPEPLDLVVISSFRGMAGMDASNRALAEEAAKRGARVGEIYGRISASADGHRDEFVEMDSGLSWGDMEGPGLLVFIRLRVVSGRRSDFESLLRERIVPWEKERRLGAGSETGRFLLSNGFDFLRILRISSLAGANRMTEHADEALYHGAFGPTGALMLTPVVVGLARAAFESALEQLARSPKRIAYTFVADTRQVPTTQMALAQASALIDSALLQVRAAADTVDEAARAGDPMDRTRRSFERMRCAQAVRSSRQALDLILDVLGASGFALSNPVQRMWRDMNVASRHGFIHPENGIGVYARAIAGVEETVLPIA